MAEAWQGRSKGTVTGHRIFVLLMHSFGVKAAYGLLVFVAFYYCIFSPSSTRSTYRYFRHMLGRPVLHSITSVYWNYFAFGQSIIDKVAISSGLQDQFTFQMDGVERIQALLDEGHGGILISAHVGNFEIAEHFLGELTEKPVINLLTTDRERSEIKAYLESVTNRSNVKFILYREDMGHVFEMSQALAANELICLTGDRYSQGMKFLEAPFLGKMAKFPAGPFLLGSRIRPQVLFVHVMKEGTSHYHLYARQANVVRGDAQDLLGKYVADLEGILRKYPLQWFNYFDFWGQGAASTHLQTTDGHG